MKPSAIVTLAGLAVLLLMLSPAQAQFEPEYDVDPKSSTDGTPVPDVDKIGVPQIDPLPPDKGCWAATAANVLAAAGWGVPGLLAQERADQIYQDLIDEFEYIGAPYLTHGGDPVAAAKWWVHNIGLNQAHAGGGYSPTCTYVNFRVEDRGFGSLRESDYNFLLDELVRCQYVGVSLRDPTNPEGGHAMTLVGGNYGPSRVPASPDISVWHNSDKDGGDGPDEPKENTWGIETDPAWGVDLPATPGDPSDDWVAAMYFTACPGLPKPESAISNFDVHYYIGLFPFDTQQGMYPVGPQLIATGVNNGVYTASPQISPSPRVTFPYWINDNYLMVPNEAVADPDLYKKIYLSVDFTGTWNLPPWEWSDVYDIRVHAEGLEYAPDSVEWADDWGQVLLTFILDGQPEDEVIEFPSAYYRNLTEGNILEWNLATECVPEPATLALLVLGGLGVLLKRRRN